MAQVSGAADYAESISTKHSAIRYFENPLQDAVSKLQSDPELFTGSLPVLLKKLSISPESQILVFSKTSIQAPFVSPQNPRAIYFNDEVAVAYVPGADSVEIASLDPNQGTIFFQLHQGSTVKLERSELCLQCHQGPATSGIPGMFVGSVFPNLLGVPSRSRAIITDHRTPFADRWGGWYVTAKQGEQEDRANSVAPDPAEPDVLDRDRKQNLSDLSSLCNVSHYPVPSSDIVALMTFEHQTQAANLITRLNWEARTEVSAAQLESRMEELVRYLLFLDEVKLSEHIQSDSPFQKMFEQRGPHDHTGHSLREFDLQKRLFRYPLSYMIYSRAFQSLPANVRTSIYRKIYDWLLSTQSSVLSREERAAIIHIVQETCPNLPSFWGTLSR